MKTFKDFLNEAIFASQAYKDDEAIKTVIDRERDLGFIVLGRS